MHLWAGSLNELEYLEILILDGSHMLLYSLLFVILQKHTSNKDTHKNMGIFLAKKREYAMIHHVSYRK
jgi:hypothetical protein